ncbi:MAG: hypothetical protein EXR99_00905 [Gemmataceae bacterium]|nr:hypothetical protein [Gemmataceae bacterium]
MPFITILIALDLLILGIVGYQVTGRESPTALIPCGIGLLFLALGFLALKNGCRKHAMHGVAGLALLAMAATFSGLLELPKLIEGMNQVARPAAVISKSITSLLSLHLFLFCLISFVEARLARFGNPPGTGTQT